ncbi:MAG: dTDP-4-dehydrorhamnose reductase [Gammaproteobacteria bacterium]|uniref:dTDP-4-dehydrorhamnose reductase n=1 Tax=Pseudomaricurvus alcaniphilus TaxID=1166482 RepID=UPI001407FA39|nr:dTDP-4-dehydrorhamnose reductase [Pseudomaricurvus alcaniphilus]MBR9910095.1 dTDP-4-dehydrorhamnose reductase [Gammaproteobacteria bacterium]NHN36611.1 dTDP-4-dehydrorhamnose reductase [Pseudomaricurvus alcaniphilus]
MTFKVLLFGANGQVGHACGKALGEIDAELVALDRRAADFADPQAVYEVIKQQAPDFVVNACAYTAVDKAESDAELAHAVNAASVTRMGEACAELGIPTLHLSTDYVFNGTADQPYTEDSAVDPIGVYGASKLAGEQGLQAANPRHIIMRTSWVFGEQGNNFVKTMLRLGAERPELGVVGDQIGCPSYSGDLAHIIRLWVQAYQRNPQQPWGIYHCSNKGQCSWYEFAAAVFAAGVDCGLLPKAPQLKQLTTDQYPTVAARPAYSVLNCDKLEAALGVALPHWQAGLNNVCNALKAAR